MTKCNISQKELSIALEISPEKLDDICNFFDSDPSDNWELVEGEHFEWGAFGARRFSPEGAVEICQYLEQAQEERPLLQRFKRWLLRRDRRLKGLMVQKRVQSVGSLDGQLVFINNKAFLGPRACREILGLGRRQDILNRTFVEIQRSENTEIEPLQVDIDFFENERAKKYLSRSGIASVGKQLGARLSQKHRREWAKVVSEYAPKALVSIEKYELEGKIRIQKAMERVRSRARKQCQLTGRRQNIEKFDLEVHHIYSQKTYPQLAEMEENMIAIAGDIHLDFHKWMGGTHKSCTIEDLEKYIEEFSSSLFPEGKDSQAMKVNMHLSRVKPILRTVSQNVTSRA
ncbi:hypothetical protein [Synechococcus sp. PCC 7336]|uniref:hypothetical protein n=1 Tax=Synechococcus sp. PCC 7336 TaxID=195250 RepID=UPI0003452108|nr:hypothetical protein [Synechococcus sp. PCC 7336]